MLLRLGKQKNTGNLFSIFGYQKMAEFRKRTVRVSNEGKVFELEIDDEHDDQPQSTAVKNTDHEDLEEEPEQNSLDFPEDSFIWSRKATMLLIKTRLDMDNEFINPTVKKTKLWQKIANILRQNNYLVQSGKCDDKWRNLLQTYRKIKRRKADRASGWQYFAILDEAMKTRIKEYPLEDRKFVRLRDVVKQKKRVHVERDLYSSDSSYSDEVNDMLIQHESSRKRPEVIRIQPEVSKMIHLELSRNAALEAKNIGNFSQQLRGYKLAPSVTVTPSAPKVQILESPKVPVVEPPRVPVVDAAPSWLNLVLNRLEERDNRAQARESARWDKLLDLMESQRQVELEKVKAISNLTEMLEQYFKQKSDLT